jgi:hypothetical protein
MGGDAPEVVAQQTDRMASGRGADRRRQTAPDLPLGICHTGAMALAAVGHVADRPVPNGGGGGGGDHGSSIVSVPPVRTRCSIAPR